MFMEQIVSRSDVVISLSLNVSKIIKHIKVRQNKKQNKLYCGFIKHVDTECRLCSKNNMTLCDNQLHKVDKFNK